MAAKQNIFDFLHDDRLRMSAELALDFAISVRSKILQTLNTELLERLQKGEPVEELDDDSQEELIKEKFVEQLLEFLQTANETSLNNLKILGFLLRNQVNPLIASAQKKNPNSFLAIYSPSPYTDILAGLTKDNDHVYAQKALQNTEEVGEVVKRKLPDILLHQAHQAKKQIESISSEFNELKKQAENPPPKVYEVFFKNPTRAMDLSFSSFAEAEKCVFDNHDKPDFFIVEIQAKNIQELNAAKQAFIGNGSEHSWPNNQINSLTSFTQGIKEKQQYNPNGPDNVARTIKQLNTMIERLQQTNWLFKLIETVTGRHGLTDKKIQALHEIKNQVVEQKEAVAHGATSLHKVLTDKLEDKQENKTITIKKLLKEQRFGFSNDASTTTEMMNDLVESTRPSMK